MSMHDGKGWSHVHAPGFSVLCLCALRGLDTCTSATLHFFHHFLSSFTMRSDHVVFSRAALDEGFSTSKVPVAKQYK